MTAQAAVGGRSNVSFGSRSSASETQAKPAAATSSPMPWATWPGRNGCVTPPAMTAIAASRGICLLH